jgi:hypothetical protein
MPTKNAEVESAALLKIFKKKRYVGQQTVVVSFLGDASLLDNAKNFYFMKPHHHLLLRPEDFADEAALQARLDTFFEYASTHQETMLDEAIDEFTKTNSEMRSKPQNKSKILENLKNIGVKKKAREKYYKLLADSKSDIKQRLKQVAGERGKKKLATLAKQEDIGKKLKIKLPKITKPMQKDLAFIDNQALRLIENKDTHAVIAHAIRFGPQEIICTEASQEKLMANGQDLTGQALPSLQRIIITLDSRFRSAFPSLSPLGGVGTSGAITACAQEGKLAGSNTIRTPVIRLFAEEFHDYMMSATLKGEASDLAKQAKDELRNTRDSLSNLLQGKTTPGASRKHGAALASLKAQLNSLLDSQAAQKKYMAKTIEPTQKTARHLASIAHKVINDEKLSGSEEKKWQQMKELAEKIEPANQNNKPGMMILSQAKGAQSNKMRAHQLNGVDMNFKLAAADLHEPNCGIPSNEQINQYDITPSNPWLEKQKAWLYRWVSSEIDVSTSSIQTNYSPDKYKSEFLGKMFAYYAFFPGYIESFLPKLHQDFLDAREKIITSTAAPDGACANGSCDSACVRPEPLSDITFTPITNKSLLTHGMNIVQTIAASAIQSIDGNMRSMLMLQFANLSLGLLQQWCASTNELDGIYGNASRTLFGGFNSTSQCGLLAPGTQQLIEASGYPYIH